MGESILHMELQPEDRGLSAVDRVGVPAARRCSARHAGIERRVVSRSVGHVPTWGEAIERRRPEPVWLEVDGVLRGLTREDDISLRRQCGTFITQAVSGRPANNAAIGPGREQRRVSAERVPSEEDVPWVLELRQRTMNATDF